MGTPESTKNKRKRSKRGWGHLYKRGSDGKPHPPEWTGKGNFYLSYRTGPKGDRKQVRIPLKDIHGTPITTKAEAEVEQQRVMAPIKTGSEVESLKAKLVMAGEQLERAVEESKDGVPISGGWQAYLDSKERPDTGDATLRQYGFQWNRFEKWIHANHSEITTLVALTRDHAQQYATDLLNAGLSGNSINKHIGLLSLIFRTLADEAGIKVNPWEKIARRKQTSKERRELTTEELRRIVRTAEDPMKTLIAIGIYTGLRLGDCCTLLWSEVDLDQGFIIRVPNKTASSGKPVRIPLFRDLATMLGDERQKTKGEYVLPGFANLYLSGRPDRITTQIQQHFWNCGIDCHAPGTGRQIKRDKDGNPILTRYGNATLEPTGERAVVRCGFHSLRHTFVSLCRQANAPLSVVESIVGHSNPAMTRHYSHTGDTEATKAIAELPTMDEIDPMDTVSQDRPPIPQWAERLVRSMTAKNWAKVKAEILKGEAV